MVLIILDFLWEKGRSKCTLPRVKIDAVFLLTYKYTKGIDRCSIYVVFTIYLNTHNVRKGLDQGTIVSNMLQEYKKVQIGH